MNAKEFVEKFGVKYDADAGELRDKDDHEVEVNDNCLCDYACPECGDRGWFRIAVNASIMLADDGIRETNDNDDYDGDSHTDCCECDYSGEVRRFKIPGLDELLQEIYDAGQEAEADEEDPTITPAPEPETSSTTPPPAPPIGWDTSGIQ